MVLWSWIDIWVAWEKVLFDVYDISIIHDRL